VVHIIFTELERVNVGLGGLVVACLLLDSRFAGLNPAKDDETFKGDKTP
jgi:hypothetical protein